MYLGLQQKIFYFLTDRQTNYQFLVDNRNNKQPHKHIYYPEEYEKMSPKSLEKYNKSIIRKFLIWSFTNKDKLSNADKNIVNSIIIDTLAIIAISAFAAKSLRKILFRTQLPVIQIKLERLGFNIRLFKAFISYSIFTFVGYKFLQNSLYQRYLIDLAFQYKYYFADKMKSNVDNLYQELWKIRQSKKSDQVV